MFCKNCGSQLDDNAVVCPHCGVPTDNYVYIQQPAQQPVQVQQPTNVLAIVGFILSFFVAIAGLVCSIIGYKNAAKYNGNGKGLALAGIIISAVLMGLGLILFIVIFMSIMAGISAGLYSAVY